MDLKAVDSYQIKIKYQKINSNKTSTRRLFHK